MRGLTRLDNLSNWICKNQSCLNTTGINFINILLTAFALIFFQQKITNLHKTYTAVQKKSAYKNGTEIGSSPGLKLKTIIQAALSLLYFCQKITNFKCKSIKASQNTFI